ncbi:hypothetical protein Bca52824_004733 [Brassica carinata]|uniref:Uncharacterized protein n=1 Tax=Brassica carinata TaxID=52824 RepID=A0A8X7WSK4_BRACI|nr:hypothetical protein Bca52824_004733 [Brassica carinata]
MAYQTNFHQTPPFFVALRRWWSRPMVTVPPSDERSPTGKEMAAMYAPFSGGFFTVLVVFLIFLFIDKAHSHAKISSNPSRLLSNVASRFCREKLSSRYSIYYDGDDAAVRLGSQNVAVLNITSERVSRDHTAFSLSFVAEEENRSDVISEELKIKLRAKHKRYVDDDEAGHFNIRCQNVSRGRDKIICESSLHF